MKCLLCWDEVIVCLNTARRPYSGCARLRHSLPGYKVTFFHLVPHLHLLNPRASAQLDKQQSNTPFPPRCHAECCSIIYRLFLCIVELMYNEMGIVNDFARILMSGGLSSFFSSNATLIPSVSCERRVRKSFLVLTV